MHTLTFAPTFTGWQKAARRALRQQWVPDEILWQEQGGAQPLLDVGGEVEAACFRPPLVKVPKAFIDCATRVACHSDPRRWRLLYRVLWRITHGEPALLRIVVDADVHLLHQLEKAIRRDVHKMRAFVRFRAVEREGITWYVAWFEPAHHIVELNAPFFVDRFANLNWSILTPDRCAHWEGRQLTFTAGANRCDAPSEDGAEALWLTYYAHIFNPARVKTQAMQAEMPKRYWKNLPETAVIPALLREAPGQVASMMAKSGAKSKDAAVAPALLPATKYLKDRRQVASKRQA